MFVLAIVIFTIWAWTQVPDAIECRPSDPSLESCNCPSGTPGLAIQGEEGPAGRDCVVMQFPDGSFGCMGRDDKRYVLEDLFGKVTSRIKPSSFWSVLFVVASLPVLVMWLSFRLPS